MKTLLTILLPFVASVGMAQSNEHGVIDTNVFKREHITRAPSEDLSGYKSFDESQKLINAGKFDNSTPFQERPATPKLFLNNIGLSTSKADIEISAKDKTTGHYIIKFKRTNLYWVNDSTAVYKP